MLPIFTRSGVGSAVFDGKAMARDAAFGTSVGRSTEVVAATAANIRVFTEQHFAEMPVAEMAVEVQQKKDRPVRHGKREPGRAVMCRLQDPNCGKAKGQKDEYTGSYNPMLPMPYGTSALTTHE